MPSREGDSRLLSLWLSVPSWTDHRETALRIAATARRDVGAPLTAGALFYRHGAIGQTRKEELRTGTNRGARRVKRERKKAPETGEVNTKQEEEETETDTDGWGETT